MAVNWWVVILQWLFETEETCDLRNLRFDNSEDRESPSKIPQAQGSAALLLPFPVSFNRTQSYHRFVRLPQHRGRGHRGDRVREVRPSRPVTPVVPFLLRSSLFTLHSLQSSKQSQSATKLRKFVWLYWKCHFILKMQRNASLSMKSESIYYWNNEWNPQKLQPFDLQPLKLCGKIPWVPSFSFLTIYLFQDDLCM